MPPLLGNAGGRNATSIAPGEGVEAGSSGPSVMADWSWLEVDKVSGRHSI